MEPNRVSGPEPRVDHGVGGEDRDAVLHDAVGDRLRDRDLPGVDAGARVPVLDHHGNELVVGLLLEHEEATVRRHVLEHDVHDLLEHFFDRTNRDEGLRHLGEHLEDPVGLLDLGDVGGGLLPVGRGHAPRDVGGREQARQLSHAADDRPRFLGERLVFVEDDLAFEGLAERELELAEQDPVAVLERGLDDGNPVHLGPVLRFEVGDADAVLVDRDPGVGPGDAEVLQHDLAVGRPSDHHLPVVKYSSAERRRPGKAGDT
jgi:hypothetical protein